MLVNIHSIIENNYATNQQKMKLNCQKLWTKVAQRESIL